MRLTAARATMIALLAAGAAAAHEPQPCLDDTMVGFVRYDAAALPPGVLFSPVKLQRNGREHPVHAFSAIADTVDGTKRVCVRNEVRNLSQEDIFGIRWARAGIRGASLEPAGQTGDLRVLVDLRPGHPPMVPTPGAVTAFESAEGRAEAYAPPVFGDAAPGMMFAATSDNLAPALQAELLELGAETQGRAVEPVFAAYAFGGEADPPQLESRFSVGGGVASFISNASIDADNWVTVENVVVGEGLGGLIFVPFLEALSNPDFSEPGAAYRAALASFNETRLKPAAPVDGVTSFTLRFPAPITAEGTVGVAIVRHPATVITEGGVDCIMVATYAPAPFALSLDDCHGFETNLQ